jgi:hypothetical protein
MPDRKGRWSDDDLAKLAAARETRYRRREARIRADRTLDERVKAWYLDRTIWINREAAKQLGVTSQRITHLRGGRAPGRRARPHPSVAPPIDTIEGYIADVAQPGTEAGAWREWAVKRGFHRLNRETGALYKTAWRVGRPRAERPTVGKAHEAGTPRKAKQRRTPSGRKKKQTGT